MKLEFEKAIASMDSANPHQTLATFIFADDKPNKNNQGLPFSEFENIRRTAIGMPVKMRFSGFGAGDHEGSVPIGVIQDMEIVTLSDDYHQLVAKAALWTDEYPDEIAWLKKAFAAGNAPGISYEVNYAEFNVAENIQWLSDTFTGAATFVKTPAYGTRTALIALSSVKDENTLKERLIALAQELAEPKPIEKGGNQMELEEVIKERDTFKAEAASKQTEIETLQTANAEKDGTINTLQTEIDNMKKAALLDSRVRKYTEAGFTFDADEEKANQKKTLLASFDDPQWESYLSDLLAVKAAIPAPAPRDVALASLNRNPVPKPEETEPVTLDYASLKAMGRSFARPNE